MNRRGATLLVVLWLLVVLTGVAGLALAGARTGVRASGNRLVLLRAGWGAEACLEILQQRMQTGWNAWPSVLAELDSVDLGGGLWCRATMSDPGERVHLNLASASSLDAVLRDSALVALILAARPLPAIEALAFHHGVDRAPVSRLASLLTIRGTGVINVNRAPAEVLLGVPGFDREAAHSVIRRRGMGEFTSLDEVLSVLPSASRQQVLRRYSEFVAAATVRSAVLVAVAEGRVGRSPLVARTTATLVPAAGRLATIRREVE